ncbi:PGF-CTERM sorting domain-containing protein [Natronomonas salina]|uniref:PGF-CTERM sorting domain-containing protein n=1 Tax=Natronomonas salina TaxID=1710540 RepID=UPI0015B4B427|nr:PGF-CTERM sorting domain-containing protein [Natronomonas salina]QLD89722.1 PGF-CTERM sorting domain-containing protein [Natronomonas salina]
MRAPTPHFAALLCLVCVGLAVGTAPAAAADGDVSLYQAADDVDDAADLEAAVADGSAAPAEKLVAGDGLGVVVESDRLASDLENRSGSTTERFFAALDGEADLRVVQADPASDRAAKRTRLGPENATVHRNGSTVYVLADTGGLTFERAGDDDGEPEPLRDDERYAFTFGYDLDETAADGPAVDLYTTPSEFNTGSTNWFAPLPPEEVRRSVTVNVEPEERHVARITLEDGREVTDAVGPVEWAEKPGVTLDLRDVEPGTDYTLELLHDGEVVDSYEGTVREPEATVTNVSVTVVNNWTAVNATANLSHGGEVRVVNEDGDRLGWSAVPPSAETHVSVRLRGSAEELVVKPAREVGADERFYAGSWTTIDASDLEIRDPLASPTPTPMDTATATPTGTATDASTASDASPEEDQPGFGVGLGVVALLATALLARRRA